MDSCLLCLELNKEPLDTIKVDSKKWQDLNIKQILEKHFWPINNIQNFSWICLACWKEVEVFHNFYMRIEEAHTNFGRIKVELLTQSFPLECKEEEAPIEKIGAKDVEDGEKGSFGYCFLEPEILIDQPKPMDIVVAKESLVKEHMDELDIDDIPLKEAYKRLRIQNNIDNEDPLEKAKKPKASKHKNKKSTYDKQSADNTPTDKKNVEDSKIKEEPIDNNNDSDSSNSYYNDDDHDGNFQPEKGSLETVECKKRKSYNKHRTNRKENDKFIAEHFKQMFCDICQVPFEDFPTMQKHFTESHKQRGYVVCCKRKFFDRTRLVDHIHCHLNPDHFKCSVCGKAMSDRISFDSHMLRVHRANEVVKQHSCDVCGKSFTEAYVLRIHKLKHLPEEEKKFPCQDCGKNYGSPYVLNQHRQAVHLKRFVKICYICGKSINTSAEFKAHMNKHEGIPGPVINCDVCGLRLTSERGLKLHKESQHPVGGKQEHPCPICPKVSPTLKALKKHINTMHEKGYDHKCSICEKAFKRAEALKEHMATHTGTTLYTCPWCPKTFNSNGNMHAHRKKVHPKEWEETKMQKYATHIPNAPEI